MQSRFRRQCAHYLNFPNPLHRSLCSMFDACRPAPGTDARIIRRALSEPFEKTQDRLRELGRPPQAWRPSHPIWPDGTSICIVRLNERLSFGSSRRAKPLCWGHLPKVRLRPSGRAKQQDRLPGRNPVSPKTAWTPGSNYEQYVFPLPTIVDHWGKIKMDSR